MVPVKSYYVFIYLQERRIGIRKYYQSHIEKKITQLFWIHNTAHHELRHSPDNFFIFLNMTKLKKGTIVQFWRSLDPNPDPQQCSRSETSLNGSRSSVSNRDLTHPDPALDPSLYQMQKKNILFCKLSVVSKDILRFCKSFHNERMDNVQVYTAECPIFYNWSKSKHYCQFFYIQAMFRMSKNLDNIFLKKKTNSKRRSPLTLQSARYV